jgi:hypothetical protein
MATVFAGAVVFAQTGAALPRAQPSTLSQSLSAAANLTSLMVWIPGGCTGNDDRFLAQFLTDEDCIASGATWDPTGLRGEQPGITTTPSLLVFTIM